MRKDAERTLKKRIPNKVQVHDPTPGPLSKAAFPCLSKSRRHVLRQCPTGAQEPKRVAERRIKLGGSDI
jgi:hypothetical protein